MTRNRWMDITLAAPIEIYSSLLARAEISPRTKNNMVAASRFEGRVAKLSSISYCLKVVWFGSRPRAEFIRNTVYPRRPARIEPEITPRRTVFMASGDAKASDPMKRLIVNPTPVKQATP